MLTLLALSFTVSVAVGLAAALVSVKEGRSNLASLRAGSSAFVVAMTLCLGVLAVARL
ncbi:hypothetical protein ACFCX4_03425 [Kitasatospora sp. NPDC056327]|uniref:hypothetical protein n=1 Tax=Kitasatospora sp. NPDC056327 TaxID=3345785 RepID=UPI0035DA2222